MKRINLDWNKYYFNPFSYTIYLNSNKGKIMSINTNTNVAENVEKVKSVALEVAVPTEIVALPVSEKSDAVVLTVAAGDVQAYGQLVLLTKEAKKVCY